MIRNLRRAGALLVAGVVAIAIVPVQPVAAFSYPGTVWSYYMDTATTSTLYDMGCSLGTARAGGSGPQDALVFLDYGQAQFRSGVYGTYDYASAYRTVTQIKNAAVAYAHGFYVCTGSNTSAQLRIAIGTNNYSNFSKNAGMTDAEVVGFGKAWADMIDSAESTVYASYGNQVDVVGAADIEVGWGTAATARSWVTAYDSVNNWAMYDFGDAAGCPTSGATSSPDNCGNSWDQDDLYFIAWGSPSAAAVPENYRADNVMAKQWQQISRWATLAGKTKIGFTGSMATTTGNDGLAAWTGLVDACKVSSATALSGLEFSTRIHYH